MERQKMEKLLTLKEVSQIMCSNDPEGRYVRNLWKSGKLVGAKIGRNLVFRESDVEDFIDAQFNKQNKRTS